MKSGEEAVYFLLDRMNEIGVDYMIVGSFSSNAYGIARATKDADFVVQTTEDKRRQLMPDPEAAQSSIRHRTFRPQLGGVRSRTVFKASQHHSGGRTAWLPSPEDVVIQKLRWASLAKRPQDLIDASNVIRVSGEYLDWPYIEKWCADLGASDALAEARAIAED